MKHSKCTLILAAASLLIVPAVVAQSGSETGTRERQVFVQVTAAPGPGGRVAAAIDQLEFELKTVKGAPYSAETESETVQTLADGNRIVRRNNSRIYRDSEGRTRHEYSIAPGEGARSRDMISIQDPVAGVGYTLHPGPKTAEKIVFSGNLRHISESTGGKAEWQSDDNTRFFIRKSPAPDTLPRTGGQPGIENTLTIHITEPERLDRNFASESLGKRIMEGIEVEGKRTSVTLPAGAIGNEFPIVTTTETWFSPELQTTIYSRREDPLSGTTTFKVTRLVRGEPDAKLFQLPAEYSVSEGGHGLMHKIEATPKR